MIFSLLIEIIKKQLFTLQKQSLKSWNVILIIITNIEYYISQILNIFFAKTGIDRYRWKLAS